MGCKDNFEILQIRTSAVYSSPHDSRSNLDIDIDVFIIFNSEKVQSNDIKKYLVYIIFI